MKKMLIVIAAMTALSVCAFAQENESEKVRVDIVAADSVCTNIFSTVNTTTLGVRIGLNNNKVGILAGGMLREGFCTGNIESGFNMDFYIGGNPFIGVELWNAEILAGLTIVGEGGIGPYVALNYNIDLIKPETGFTDRLSLKLGAEYFWDGFTGAHSNAENAGLDAVAIDIVSTMIPKVSVGIQYTFGWGF